jgi:hypothetical protein
MKHARQRIREAIAAALTGLATTGARVYVGRDLPLDADTELPALCIYTRQDTPDYELATMTREVYRALEVTVNGYAKSTTDDELDKIAAEVETAIYADQTFGGLALGMSLGEQTIEATDEGDRIVGRVEMLFTVAYRVAEGAPEAALT